jgi:YbbR domain-containing protein
MAIIKLSKGERRRLSVFFTCLVLAFAAWILTMLSNQYSYPDKMVVNFINPPVKRSFRALQSDTVEATVQGNGWNMLFSKMNMEDKRIAVDLKTLDSKDYILLSTQLRAINEKRLATQQIVSFNPDTLYFDFSSRAVKRVPVQLQYNLTFKRQFIVSDGISIKPDYVTVTGPEETISKIKYWKTDSLSLHSVEGPVDENVRLEQVPESNMSIYPKSIRVHIPVSEFTEKTVEVPVKLINNKNYYNVKIFPQKVKITFTVSLGRYSETDEHSFEAVVDLDEWQLHGYNQLPVKVTVFPPFCKLVSVDPQNLDFIVKE